MTIAERKAREQRDRENPWRPMSTAKADGTICELLFQDMAGHHAEEDLTFFLDADGYWYRISPAARIYQAPMNWRPAYVKLTPERRSYLKRQATEGS